MEHMYWMGASFNFYMFHGGTNFGYMTYATTSYDYDAPLSEAGDPSNKFIAIRNKISRLVPWNIPQNVTGPSPKSAYGKVKMRRIGTVLDMLEELSPFQSRHESVYPQSMEDVDFPYGFLLYETRLSVSGSELSIPGIKDRGYVMVSGDFAGIVHQKFAHGVAKLWISINGSANSSLQILVENMGRSASGCIIDRKGITANVTLDGQILTHWTMYPINLDRAFHPHFHHSLFNTKGSKRHRNGFVPSIYAGRFTSRQRKDTFFDPTGWGKGQFLLNGINVGRYWPRLGPQVTLYTPKPFLKGGNKIILFELEKPGNCVDDQKDVCTVEFTDKPYLNKTPPALSNLGDFLD